MANIEKYLEYLANNTGEIPVPQCDADHFLFYLCTGSGHLPNPDTRLEKYLDYLCRNGGLSGSQGPTKYVLLTSLEKIVDKIPENCMENDIYYIRQK